MTQPNPRQESTEILRGIGLLFLCHLAAVTAFLLLNFLLAPIYFYLPSLWVLDILFQIPRMIATFSVFAIGLSQAAYAIPLHRRFKRRRRLAAAKGVVIGATLTALLNGSCFAYFLFVLS